MSPCLIIFGLMGNSLVFVVLTKSSMKKTTCSLYLRFLSVFDSLVLCVSLMRYWTAYITLYDIRSYSSGVCKIHTWATYWTSHTSAWLLVSVTVERCVSVWFPHKVKMFCTKRKTYTIIISIILVTALISSHYFYGIGLNIVENESYCVGMYADYSNFETFAWPWVDLCIYSLFPSTILFICKISIIYKVVHTNRGIVQNDSSNGNDFQNSSATTSRRSQESSLTAMLLITSITYIVCTTPLCVFIIYNTITSLEIFKSPLIKAVGELVWAVTNMLQFTNNSINFILYCVSGRRFREELKYLCYRKQQRRPVIYSVPPANTRSRDTNIDIQ